MIDETIEITIDIDAIDLGLQEDLETAKTTKELLDVLERITGKSRADLRKIKARDLKRVGEQIASAIKQAIEIPN